MGVIERNGRFGARLYLGSSRWRWLGTYSTRDKAERALRYARQPKRRELAINDHWVYRCYDRHGDLLYVGITSVGIRRFRRHGDHRSWWSDVDTIRLDHFETREEAEEAERRAIRDLQPLHNVRLLDREDGELGLVYVEPRGEPEVEATCKNSDLKPGAPLADEGSR